MHKSQNKNPGLFGMAFTIQTRAIDIVMLNKNIPMNQQIGCIFQSNRNGNDNKMDETQIFNHQYLSAIIQPKAFHNAIMKVNHNTIGIQTFRE